MAEWGREHRTKRISQLQRQRENKFCTMEENLARPSVTQTFQKMVIRNCVRVSRNMEA